MKNLILVCFFLIISFLFAGCYTVFIVIPPDEVIIDNLIQLPIDNPPAPPLPGGPPIIIVPIPDPTPITYPPAVIIAQPKPAEPVKPDRREIHAGRGPANQKPAAPTIAQREPHSGRNSIVSNPPSQTYFEQSGSRNDSRENIQRPARDAGVKRNTR